MKILETLIAISGWMLGLLILSFLIFLFYFGYLIFCYRQERLNKRKVALGVGILLFSLFIYIADKLIIESVLDKTDSMLKNPSTKILVDGVVVNAHEELLAAFENRIYLKNSGSRPIKYISVALTDSDFSITYVLGQDSRERELYWVYIPEMKRRSSLCYVRLVLK